MMSLRLLSGLLHKSPASLLAAPQFPSLGETNLAIQRDGDKVGGSLDNMPESFPIVLHLITYQPGCFGHGNIGLLGNQHCWVKCLSVCLPSMAFSPSHSAGSDFLDYAHPKPSAHKRVFGSCFSHWLVIFAGRRNEALESRGIWDCREQVNSCIFFFFYLFEMSRPLVE